MFAELEIDADRPGSKAVREALGEGWLTSAAVTPSAEIERMQQQDLTKNTFKVPSDRLSQDELSEIDSVHAILTTGTVSVTEVNFIASPGDARNLLARIGEHPANFRLTKPTQEMQVLGQLVNMGPLNTTAPVLYPSSSFLTAFRKRGRSR